MIVARSGKQQRLAAGAENLADSREHEVADDFGARRAAGLARHQYLGARTRKPLGQQLDLGRLARALAALECNEAAARWIRCGHHCALGAFGSLASAFSAPA